tara:strand:- start:325 stop:678 length:354 start_codon:yes stop_codon:yes gene_type:complete
MTTSISDAKERAIARQRERLENRLAQLRNPPPPNEIAIADIPPDEIEPKNPTCEVRDDGYRTYYTFEGTLEAAQEAAKRALAPYTFPGVNPYSPVTKTPVDLGDGKVRLEASRCSSV